MQETITQHGAPRETVPRTRRTYTREFKAQIVALCEKGDRSIAQVALEHQINANLIHKWCRSFRSDKPQSMLPVTVQSLDADRCSARIEVSVGDVTVRFYRSVDQPSAIAVLKALP